ncbi:UNVERIFIED_CONTAM: hypothetical protein GTU68_047369 [Idotea baltica]|nr:hypothetical protein [Idotea baltica]
MSHEIRTPLNGVLGMAEVVSRSINDPGQRRNLEVIHQSGNHLLEVIDDILDFSKIEAGHFELSYSDVQLSEFMHDLYKIHKPFATRKGIELILALPSDFEGKVEFDQVRLRRVLTNLIHNALKFTEQGQVNITVTATERSSDSTRLSFEVSDTGIGIEAGQLDSVFKPFKQADGSATRKHGGAGLGLAISRQLIGLMGGDLEVSSEPGIGSRFSFAIECKALNSNASPETLPRQSLSRPAIPLEVVEDSLPNQEVARAMLEWLGCEVVVAENGLIALDAVRKREFDLILMDCQMPEMGGLEATRRMRMKQQTEGTRHIPIVALTANAVLGDREECERAGMDDYIAKPFELKDLEDALAKWCTKRTDAIINREEKHDLQ